MEASQIPVKFPVVWGASATSGYIRTIPTTTSTPGAASLQLGFPPITFQNEATGGVPLDGRDENGILNQITAWSQWQNMGGPVTYDSVFSAAIGGYPQGAWLYAAAGDGWWISLIDNNTSDPDTGGVNWQYLAFGTSYYGNPNGNVAGVSVSQYGLSQALLWDTQNKILWICTTTGAASTAVWTQLTGSLGSVWCGTSGGTVNAQVLTPPTSLQALTAGLTITFKIGSTLTNTGATTIQIGSFGTFPARKQSPSGSIALAGGELVGGNYVTAIYDGAYMQFTSIAMGTAAQANASSDTGTVAAVVGSITPGHITVFADNKGSVQDGGIPGAAAAPTYINASNNGEVLGPGVYLVDTSIANGGAFGILMPSSLTTGQSWEFIDASGTFSPNHFTINRNGNTIMGNAENLICNSIGLDFRMWFNGTTLELE